MKSDCRICGSATVEVGQKYGDYAARFFTLLHCPRCHFSFVADPWTEYSQIYSEDYYAGKGADPYVDYVFELEHPNQTVRIHEWSGILKAVQALTCVTPTTRWLDFGCGNGGLVRYVKQQTGCNIVGFDEGWISERAAATGIPFLPATDLDAHARQFDIVTAIEVFEHIIDPLESLQTIRRLLKPGGLLFCTTGNAQPFRDTLLSWSYFLPEIHVSLYEPETLVRALMQSGFEPQFPGFLPGFSDIIRFKVLKTLHFHRRSFPQYLLPWEGMARIINARRAVMAHPVGWAASSYVDQDSTN